MKRINQQVAIALACSVMLVNVPAAFASQADQFAAPSTVRGEQRTPEQLQQLVAPIALYPDALVAQILAAAAYPNQVVQADQWVQHNSYLDENQLAQNVDRQPWDPSVKVLTEFPSVLANMDKNMSWTSALGEAYVARPQDVMNAIQVMRQRAEQAGNLASNPQQTVTDEGNTIAIEPADPDMVYVPQYDPWLAYGAPIGVWPGWYGYPGLFWDGPGIGFGLGFGIGGFGFHDGFRRLPTAAVAASTAVASTAWREPRGGFHGGGGFPGGGGIPQWRRSQVIRLSYDDARGARFSLHSAVGRAAWVPFGNPSPPGSPQPYADARPACGPR